MDLRRWVADDHDSLRQRFHASIAAVVPHELWRARPVGGGPSIAWLALHATHHQDLALNTAVRKHPPIVAGWWERLGLAGAAATVGLPEAEDPAVTQQLDVAALVAYVDAVNAATSDWITDMSVLALDSIPESSRRLERIAGIARDDLDWLHAMWDGKPVAWLVRWECIAHGHGHLGEMVSVRDRLGLRRS